MLQSDATACPGNSGGPVFDLHGRVVGVLVVGMADTVNYSVPVSVFRDDIDTIRIWFSLLRVHPLLEVGTCQDNGVMEKVTDRGSGK